jgi:hypothetical protein
MAAAKKPAAKPFVGDWRITKMDTWDQDFVDLLGPGRITIKNGGNGEFCFGAVVGFIDYRTENTSEGLRIEFSWDGEDENDPVSGRGWAIVHGDELRGRLFIHAGDESGFIAKKVKRAI